jgi:hypothetical protein
MMRRSLMLTVVISPALLSCHQRHVRHERPCAALGRSLGPEHLPEPPNLILDQKLVQHIALEAIALCRFRTWPLVMPQSPRLPEVTARPAWARGELLLYIAAQPCQPRFDGGGGGGTAGHELLEQPPDVVDGGPLAVVARHYGCLAGVMTIIIIGAVHRDGERPPSRRVDEERRGAHLLGRRAE